MFVDSNEAAGGDIKSLKRIMVHNIVNKAASTTMKATVSNGHDQICLPGIEWALEARRNSFLRSAIKLAGSVGNGYNLQPRRCVFDLFDDRLPQMTVEFQSSK